MKWLSLALVAALARVASAQPGTTPAGPCPQADAYRNAIALHRSWQAKACVDEGSDCDDEKRAVATLTELGQRCDAGEQVGPPPTQFPKPEAHGAAGAAGEAQPFSAVFEGAGGGGLALGNGSWRSSVGVSPSLVARAGAMRGSFGVLISGEWTAGQLSQPNNILPTPNNDMALRRYRFLASFVYERSPIPDLVIGGRAGVGIDYVDARYNRASGAGPVNFDESDAGIGIEVGAGAWWHVGAGTDVGGTLSVPIAKHDAASMSMVTFSYTSFDLELLVGVRVSSRR